MPLVWPSPDVPSSVQAVLSVDFAVPDIISPYTFDRK